MMRIFASLRLKPGTAQGQPRHIIHFFDKIDKVDHPYTHRTITWKCPILPNISRSCREQPCTNQAHPKSLLHPKRAQLPAHSVYPHRESTLARSTRTSIMREACQLAMNLNNFHPLHPVSVGPWRNRCNVRVGTVVATSLLPATDSRFPPL